MTLRLTKSSLRYNIVITMQTQSIFQAGNSSVVAIPKHIMKDLNIKTGQKVFVDTLPDGETIVIKKAINNNKNRVKAGNKTSLTPEFKKWLDNFMIEYKPILKKLANL